MDVICNCVLLMQPKLYNFKSSHAVGAERQQSVLQHTGVLYIACLHTGTLQHRCDVTPRVFCGNSTAAQV